MLCALAAGCSQTTQQAATTAEARPAASKASTTKAMTKEQRCQEAIDAAMRKRQNAAKAGSGLSAFADCEARQYTLRRVTVPVLP